jgi:glycoprotein endo-alpha-1,2-mannosidase
MAMVAASGAGVVAVSWYPPGQADEHGPPSDGVVPLLLEAAARHSLAICLHIEPYEGRSPETLRRHLRYVVSTYGTHPAYYRRSRGTKPPLPVFYIYDSYRTPPQQWARLLSTRGDLSVRGTDLDAIFLGLLVDYKHRADIKQAGFDGFYTYFAADGFSHGSSWRNWRGLASWARKSSLEFVPSVGPGYLDTRVRAWNGASTRARRGGRYYEAAWGRALEVRPAVVSVTSFNEWHEGTQIEPAVAATCDGYSYEQYGEGEEGLYLRLTSKWAARLANLTRSP